MCGILAAFGTKNYELAIEQSGKLGHRGQMREGSRFSTTWIRAVFFVMKG